MEIVVRRLTAASADGALLRWWNRYAALENTYQHVLELTELRRRELHPGGQFKTGEWWMALRGGEILGLAYLELFHVEEHRRDAEIDLLLDPEAGTAAAQALLRRALAPALAGGRDRVMSWNPDVPLQHALWDRIGARLAQRIDHAFLDLTDTDPELMARWDTVPNGYTVHAWRGRCPEELIDLFCAGRRLINDAPLDDLEYPAMTYSPEFVRDDQEANVSAGDEPWVLLIEAPDGDAAGLTEVFVNTHSPGHSEQGDTAVAPAHRRRGLGRLLKGRMWRDLRRDAPGVTGLSTENALSNDPMRAINQEMGFRSGPRYAIWQAPAERILEAIG